MVWEGLFLALLVLITVGFDTLAGNGVVMVLLLVLVRVLLLLFWISFHLSFIILLTVHDQVTVGGVQVVSSGSGSRRKRFRLNRKTPAHLAGHLLPTRPRVWKRLHFSWSLCTSGVDCKRVRYNQRDGDSLVFPRTGVG